MITQLYRQHARIVLTGCLLMLPLLTLIGETAPCNNDIETWLPRRSEVRSEYDEFCRAFGAEENILIALRKPFPEPDRLSAVAARLRTIEGIGSCWTRAQVLERMFDNSVDPSTADARLTNLLSSPAGDLETMLVCLDDAGIADRAETVRALRSQLAYCGLDEAVVAGGPVVATRLDELGNRERARTLFGLTLGICFVLLQINVGCWKTSGALMLANVFSIQVTLTAIALSGQEMNFILSSLPVMVMVFTTAAGIHFIGHYRREYHHPDAVGRALIHVMRPAVFAMGTTVIGLVSLAMSDFGPIPAFGLWAAVGTFVSFVVGIFMTPAVLLMTDYRPRTSRRCTAVLRRWAMQIVNNPLPVLLPGLLFTLSSAVGILFLRSLIDPLEFLPSGDPVLEDTLAIQENLTSPTTVEVTVDFGINEGSFIDRLREVRRIEESLAAHENVCHALSLADFFPQEISEDRIRLSRLESQSTAAVGLLADGSRLWRVSLRLHNDSPSAMRQTIDSLKNVRSDADLTYTGLGPLLEYAQGRIFDGFWQSFASAFAVISLVMILALRSLGAGLSAMIPNLTPILLVFGLLGWSDIPIDIGIMMTASIALGLAVDGTFHFLFAFQDVRILTGCRYRAVRAALLNTGLPIMGSALVSGIGLLALSLSPFRPTMRFGLLMFCLLSAALAGDLLLLPAALALGAKRKRLTPRKSKPAVAARRAA